MNTLKKNSTFQAVKHTGSGYLNWDDLYLSSSLIIIVRLSSNRMDDLYVWAYFYSSQKKVKNPVAPPWFGCMSVANSLGV